MKILVLYGSSRENGNTEQLTERVLQGIECTRVYLREKKIVPIEDKRHNAEGFKDQNDDYNGIVTDMLVHDVVLFATPLYWYGMSGPMKNFVDRWSQSLRDKQLSFKEQMKEKHAYTIIVGGDHPRMKALPLVQQFAYIFDFMSMEFSGYLIGEGNAPGDIAKDSIALFEADLLNRKLLSLYKEV